MKYFLDTEFHEYHKQPKVCGIKVGKSIPTINLISIGITSEDSSVTNDLYLDPETPGVLIAKSHSSSYYTICKDFNLKDAWYSNQGTKEKSNYWLRENVLLPIHYELASKEVSVPSFDMWRNIITEKENGQYSDRHLKTLTKLINKYGKSNKQIANEIKEFVYNAEGWQVDPPVYHHKIKEAINKSIKFYAYYADYDWVVFAQLYGTMMDLPKGFPYYCNNLKQELDRKQGNFNTQHEKFPKNDYIGNIENHPNYPKQENEHNALDDAKWNKKLYEFLNTL